MEFGPWQNTARVPVEGEGRTREVLVAAIPPSPSFFVQKGCHFSVTGALLLDLKSSVFICLKIKLVEGSMDLGLPTEYYLITRLLTTPLFFKINIMELLNPLEKSISPHVSARPISLLLVVHFKISQPIPRLTKLCPSHARTV